MIQLTFQLSNTRQLININPRSNIKFPEISNATKTGQLKPSWTVHDRYRIVPHSEK
jgi:hypothetical protein